MTLDPRPSHASSDRPVPAVPARRARASPHTLKGYREDLHALAEYLADGDGKLPGAGQHHDRRAARLSFRAARSGLRQVVDLAAAGLGAQLHAFRPARRLGQSRTRPRRSATRGRAASCRTFSRPTKSASCSTRRKATRRPAIRDRAILETLYSAGLRVSELVGLTDGDLDFAAGIVRIRGKGKTRTAGPDRLLRGPRAEAAGSAVRKLSPREKTGREAPVFTNKFGTRLTTRSVARMLEKYLKETGLDQPHVAPHAPPQLRHAPAGPRRRHPQRAGTVGPQKPRHHANLHARQHGQPPRGVRKGPPAGTVTHARLQRIFGCKLPANSNLPANRQPMAALPLPGGGI